MIFTILYHFFRFLIRFTLPIFFRKTTFINEHLLQIQRPCIVVSNHPNTIIDPIHIACRFPQQNFFLANAGLFKNPTVAWWLRRFYCIPIKRSKDLVAHINNNDSFEQCDLFLAKGGCLYIAPEGSSYPERTLREIKTGTARIALSAEAKNNFSLGLTIKPIGLTYTRKGEFACKSVVFATENIVIADFRAMYEADKEAAIDAITASIAAQLCTSIINTESIEQDYLLARCETILFGKEKYTNESYFYQSKNFLSKLKTFKEKNTSAYEALHNTSLSYFQQLKSLKITDEGLSFSDNKFLLGLGIGFFSPLFLLGFALNILPFSLVFLLDKKLKNIIYDATVQYLGALIIFPILYCIEKNILLHFLPTYLSNIPFLGIVFYLIAIFSGVFALRYSEKIRLLVENLRGKNQVNLYQQRTELKRILDKINE